MIYAKMVTKLGDLTVLFSPLSFIAVFGYGIRDPGSEIWDPGWVKIRIRDKHPGSATLVTDDQFFAWQASDMGQEHLLEPVLLLFFECSMFHPCFLKV